MPPCMDSRFDEPPARAGPATRRRRQADEWALVLAAEGLEPRVVRDPAGFRIEVAADRVASAERILEDWRRERVERAARPAPPAMRRARSLETAAAYALALGLLAFHVGLEVSGRHEALSELGSSRARLVLEGELWRLVTALTLHADLAHVLGNTLFGGFFLALLAAPLGLGLALLAFVVTGTLGNIANALYYGAAHGSIGASTGVFGLVGVLAGLAAWRRAHFAERRRGAWVALGAGLGILAMLGGGGPRVDVSAHLFGLGVGAGAGLLLAAPVARRPPIGPVGQSVAAGLAIALVGGAWALARS